MPTYWIAAIVVFFVYLLPMFYLFRSVLDEYDTGDPQDMAFTVMIAVFAALGLALLWPLTIVGTVLFFVVRWLEEVRSK